jgi:hypothetical protein
MSKLQIINQPLSVADINLDQLDDELFELWDHHAESLAIRNARERQRISLSEAEI